MKNQKFIQALNQVHPSNQQKEKILNEILRTAKKPNVSWKYGWQFALLLTCFCFLLLIPKESTSISNQVPETRGIAPAAYSREIDTLDTKFICYEEICYEKTGIIDSPKDLEYLYLLYNDELGERKVYQGSDSNKIILEFENVFVQYQEIKK